MNRRTRSMAMLRCAIRESLALRILLTGLVLVLWSDPSAAVLGVRRRTAVVAASAGAAAGASQANAANAQQQQAAAAQQQQAAAAQQQQAAAQQSAAASQAAAASAASAAAAAEAATEAAKAATAAPVKSTQQRLEDLQALLKQGLITQADYDAQKAKILDEMQ